MENLNIHPEAKKRGNDEIVCHNLKVWPEFFVHLASGKKTFEIRKYDRDFRENDLLLLRECEKVSGNFTGRYALARCPYVLGDPWTAAGTVCLSVKLLIVEENVLPN